MQVFTKPAGQINYTNTGAALASGAVVDLTGRIGVTVSTIAANAVGALQLAGIFSLAKTVGQTYTQNDVLFWSASTSKLTNVPVAGDPRAGVAAADAASALTFGEVDINVAATAGQAAKIDSGDGTLGQTVTALRNVIDALENGGISSK